MSQRETLVARAIVAYEIGLLRAGRASTPCPQVTTASICEKYGLHWGVYQTDYRWVNNHRSAEGGLRAPQNVRNELNAAFRRSELCKLRDVDTGKKVRQDQHLVFVHSGTSMMRLFNEGYRKVWFK